MAFTLLYNQKESKRHNCKEKYTAEYGGKALDVFFMSYFEIIFIFKDAAINRNYLLTFDWKRLEECPSTSYTIFCSVAHTKLSELS